MDILVSSNLERLLYLLSGRNGGAVSQWMEKLDEEKSYDVTPEVREKLGRFYGGFCTEEETLDTIGKMWNENKYLMDTHTAVAYKVYEDYVAETGDETPAVIASTASAVSYTHLTLPTILLV